MKSSDITYNEYQSSLNAYGNNLRRHKLETQMRCEGGDTYLRYIREIMGVTRKSFEKIENYDFMIFDDVNLMVETVRKKDKVHGLSKTVAGFSWDWRTKQKRKPKDNMDCYDMLVKAGTEESVLKELIVNMYTTIMSRGIKGCYVYACNPNLRKYLKQYIASANEFTLKEE